MLGSGLNIILNNPMRHERPNRIMSNQNAIFINVAIFAKMRNCVSDSGVS